MMGKRAVVKELEKVKENCIVLFEREAELKFKYEALLKETEEMRRQDVELRKLQQNVRQLKHDMKNHIMDIIC